MMNRKERREAEIRNQTIRDLLGTVDLITDSDLRIVKLALEDRARIHAGTPAGEAAGHVRAKLEQDPTR